MKKAIPGIYFIILDICAILMLVGLIWGNTNVFSRIESMEKTQIYPVKEVQINEDLKEVYLDIDSPDGVSMTLEIYSGHQAVRVLADGEQIYALEGAGSIWGTTSGAKYNFIEIPVDAEEIKVVIEAIYPEDRNREVEYFVGDGIAMLRGYVRRSIPNMLMSLLSITMGVFLVGYWIITRRKVLMEKSSLYFGLFAMVLGLWTLHETDFATVLVGNRTAASYCGYMLLMLVIVPFVLFVKHFLEVEDKYIYALICIEALASIVINTIGHMAGLWYFKKSVITIHLSIGFAIAYMIYAIVQRWRKYGTDQKVRANLIGAVVLIVTVVIDVGAYYMKLKQSDLIGRIGLLVYIFLLGKETTVEFFRQVDEGRKAEIYKELAEKDVMTGMYNRNAFDEWEYNCNNCEDIMLVTFDLNNLKQCNDTLGHEVGDKYIIDAAELIQQVFGKIAKCYRIGGDEFCAVIMNASKVDVEEYLQQLKKVQDMYNTKSKDVDMQIACGYAIFDKADLNIESTRSRADARMYVHKKAIKNEK